MSGRASARRDIALKLLGQGMSKQQTATAAGVSIRTVQRICGDLRQRGDEPARGSRRHGQVVGCDARPPAGKSAKWLAVSHLARMGLTTREIVQATGASRCMVPRVRAELKISSPQRGSFSLGNDLWRLRKRKRSAGAE